MEFFVSGSQQRLKDIALNGNPIGKRTEAVKKLTDQDALFEVAQKASFDFVRKEAIMKLEDPQRVLKLAADDRGFKDRGNAVARFLSIREPETFFEEIFKVTDNRNRIADTAKLVHKDYLKRVLSGTGDAELVKMIVPVKYYFDNYRIKDIVGCDYDTYAGIVKDRILELEGDKEGAYISSLKTDGEKRAYVESLAKEKEDRLRALKTIADDKVLADILVKTGDKDIRKTAAQQIKDEAVLE
ncbi:MAG: hypothetical protein IJL97_00295, partial [Lachnospiraceae bacterium]|nr:hypothetical protein [Lachnospiraceae bacterium]